MQFSWYCPLALERWKVFVRMWSFCVCRVSVHWSGPFPVIREFGHTLCMCACPRCNQFRVACCEGRKSVQHWTCPRLWRESWSWHCLCICVCVSGHLKLDTILSRELLLAYGIFVKFIRYTVRPSEMLSERDIDAKFFFLNVYSVTIKDW